MFPSPSRFYAFLEKTILNESSEATNLRGALLVLLTNAYFYPAVFGHLLSLIPHPEIYWNSGVMGDQRFEAPHDRTVLVHMYVALVVVGLVVNQVYFKNTAYTSESAGLWWRWWWHRVVGYLSAIGFVLAGIFAIPLVIRSKVVCWHRLDIVDADSDSLRLQSLLRLLSATPESVHIVKPFISHHDIANLGAVLAWLYVLIVSIRAARSRHKVRIHKLTN